MQKNNRLQCAAAHQKCGGCSKGLPTILPASLYFINGNQFKNKPIQKMSRVRLITFCQKTLSPAASNLGITKAMALPTANKKNGNTKSVGVQPCQLACSSGGNICAPTARIIY